MIKPTNTPNKPYKRTIAFTYSDFHIHLPKNTNCFFPHVDKQIIGTLQSIRLLLGLEATATYFTWKHPKRKKNTHPKMKTIFLTLYTPNRKTKDKPNTLNLEPTTFTGPYSSKTII